MPTTLAEAQGRSNNVLEKGIIETIITPGEVLPLIPFQDFTGTTYDYRRESTLPTTPFRAVGDTWTESASTSTLVSASLKIIGGDVDVDHFLQETLSNINDQQAIELQQKLKALARTINDAIVYGDEDNDPNEWDGLHDFLQTNTGQRVELAAAGVETVLTITKLRQMLRLIKLREPDALIMSRQMRDSMSKYYESLGSALTPIERFGQKLLSFDNIPILASDYVLDTEAYTATSFSAKTGGTGTSIFAVTFGVDALMGISKGGITVRTFPDLETKDSMRTRVRWYLNPAVIKSTLAVAGITGADPDGTITA